MSKTNFTKTPLKWAIMSLLLVMLGQTESVAQAMACNNSVQVSVEPTLNLCQVNIYPDMILEGTYPAVDYEITIKKNLTTIATGINDVTINDSYLYFGDNLVASIKNVNTGQTCWGSLHMEDKLPPILTCNDVTVNCAEDLSIVAVPTADDNCDPTPEVQLSNESVDADNICGNGYVTITRQYIAFDAYGNTSLPCTQTIYVERPNVVDFPNDIVWTCEQYAAFPNIVNATSLHPFVGDSDATTASVIEVNLDEDCDDNDASGNDIETINSTNFANGGNGCPGNDLDDADVLELTGSGIVANVVGQYCQYQQSKSDQLLQTCGNTFKIVRTWTVLDWCTGAIVTSGVGGEDNIQIVKVADHVKPFISRAPFAVSANIAGNHPQPCRSQSYLLAPTAVTDNCNAVSVKIYTPIGEAVYTGADGTSGGFIPAPGLPLGVHTVVYQATDACGNQTSLNVPVTVADQLAPVAICDEITDVNLSSNGTAVIAASVFDDGTYDNCCLDHFEVRRMIDNCDDNHDDTVFGPTVVFCCEDITEDPGMVVFRAYDCDGNYNDCMVEVEVSDKIAPTLVNCPQDTRILCEEYANTLETQLANAADEDEQCAIMTAAGFGEATFYDNCVANVNCDVTISIDQCLEGFVRRRWTASDDSGNNSNQTCTQRVFVDHVSDWAVEFPADITVNCTSEVPDFGEPTIFMETCELVAISHDDQIFTTVADACFKIERTWQVINWCVVGDNIDEEVEELSEAALWNAGITTLADRDINNDGFFSANVSTKSGRTFRDSWNGIPGLNHKPNAGDATDNTNPDTDLDSDPWDGYIVYKQIIKVIDDVDPVFADGCAIPDVCIEGNSCGATVLLPTPQIDDCSPDVDLTVQIQIGGTWVSGFGPYLNVAPGTYDVRYNAQDNCNNQTACETTVTVKDCKKPTPYCKNGIIVELMQTGMVDVWATDLNAGSFDNCPGQLKYSLSSDVDDTGISFTCDDLGQQPVELWVTDAAGNQDYCETFVILQANMSQCGNNPLVAALGAIETEEENVVADVDLTFSNMASGTATTDANGLFSFNGIASGSDVTITPEMDNDPLNGVTTYDIVLLTKHILGLQALGSPYKLIAADANNSGTVTTFDAVELRKLILQITSNFSNNTSWRFVEKAYAFPNASNPWEEAFPEAISLNNMDASILDADFVAVKVGDLNGNAVTNLANAGEDRTTYGTFVLNADDQLVKKGETITVDFTAADFDVVAFQFTLNFDKNALSLNELTEGVAGEENFGKALLDKGALTSSWNANAGEAANGQMFSLTFTANETAQLSDLLNLNSRYTKAEAYNANGETFNVELAFNGQVDNGFELYQNTPNPFKGQTLIGFHLPEAGNATLTIMDVSGKALRKINRNFAEGYNQVTLNSNELPSFGVLYYTLETATETATKKMVVVQ